MAINLDNRLKLKRGLSLGYAEYGDPHGTPVLHFHGMPSSRFELFTPSTDEIATRLGVRVIVPDRPGVGLSEYMPYTLLTWPDIVSEFADALQLNRFAVQGFSSGGKYVAACALKIPQRLTAASIISGNTAYDLPGARATLSQQDTLLYTLADKAPLLLRLLLWVIASRVRKNPAAIFDLFSDASDVDKQALSQPDIQALLAKMVIGAFQQGTRGAALDWQLEARPWGFSLQDIHLPVFVWHGEQDKLVPVEQGRITARAIPASRLTLFPDDGHITIMKSHFEQILSAVLEPVP